MPRGSYLRPGRGGISITYHLPPGCTPTNSRRVGTMSMTCPTAWRSTPLAVMPSGHWMIRQKVSERGKSTRMVMRYRALSRVIRVIATYCSFSSARIGLPSHIQMPSCLTKKRTALPGTGGVFFFGNQRTCS